MKERSIDMENVKRCLEDDVHMEGFKKSEFSKRDGNFGNFSNILRDIFGLKSRKAPQAYETLVHVAFSKASL